MDLHCGWELVLSSMTKDATQRKTSAQTTLDRAVGNASAAAPLHQRLCFTVPFNAMIRTHIVRLVDFGFPLHIARSIGSIIVQSFNLMLRRWTRPHVSIEGLERFSPFGSHRNAATPVIGEVARRRILCALDDMCPDPVFGSLRAAMRAKAFRCLRIFQTATGTRRTAFQRVRDHLRQTAAGTTTPPPAFLGWIGRRDAIQGRQLSELLAGQVFGGWHGEIVVLS